MVSYGKQPLQIKKSSDRFEKKFLRRNFLVSAGLTESPKQFLETCSSLLNIYQKFSSKV